MKVFRPKPDLADYFQVTVGDSAKCECYIRNGFTSRKARLLVSKVCVHVAPSAIGYVFVIELKLCQSYMFTDLSLSHIIGHSKVKPQPKFRTGGI